LKGKIKVLDRSAEDEFSLNLLLRRGVRSPWSMEISKKKPLLSKNSKRRAWLEELCVAFLRSCAPVTPGSNGKFSGQMWLQNHWSSNLKFS
jgi:hypothetical protein